MGVYVDAQAGRPADEEATVPQPHYQQLQAGDTVRIRVPLGLLAIPWFRAGR